MRKVSILIWLVAILIFSNIATFSQKPIKLPSSIGDAFVLEFNHPYTVIYVDTDEKNRTHPEFALIYITPRTKFENHKGKQIPASEIRVGMEVKMKMDKSEETRLVAREIQIKDDPDEREESVDGYLDRVEDTRAVVDGRTVELAPNVFIKGEKDWKGKSFTSFSEIPLGSIVDLKGIRQKNGVVLISKGEAKPNIFTEIETRLLKSVENGLTIPPPNQRGAGIKIGDLTYKVVEDLDVNTYVNKVGMRVVPRYLRYLPEEDPNKLVFRFYVLEDKTPNAFATSDGSVFIFTGLLEKLENEAQLGVILGHEISHVTNEHSRRRLQTLQKQAMWMGLAGAVVGGLAGDQAGLLLASLGYGLMSSKFSRDLEDQADRVGLYYAFEAGYDIRESPKIWRRIINGRYSEASVSNILYTDHPSMVERLRNSRKEIISNYPNADFSEVIVGREEFLDGVGVYFGWVQPKPKIAPTPPKQQIVPMPKKSTPKKKPKKNRP